MEAAYSLETLFYIYEEPAASLLRKGDCPEMEQEVLPTC
jgi:hypothetical protein